MSSIPFKHEINFSLPFPSALLAQHAASVIKVDKELRPMDVVKHFEIVDLDSQDNGEGKSGSEDKKGALLNVNMKATTLRHLRISTNALLEDLSLIIRTMDQFLPDSIREEISPTTTKESVSDNLKQLKLQEGEQEEEEEEDEEFEQGKVGIAG